MAGKVVKATTHDGDNLLQCGYPVAAACSQNEESQLRALVRRKERRLKLYRTLLWRDTSVCTLWWFTSAGGTRFNRVHTRTRTHTRTRARKEERGQRKKGRRGWDEEKDESGEGTRGRDIGMDKKTSNKE